MPQDLHQVPPNLEVWDVDGQLFLVRMISDTEPPIPLAWRVRDDEEAEALGIRKADRTFSNYDEFYRTGALRHGSTTELINTDQDPWEQIQSNYETEVKVKPWLEDPEILSIWLAAALEGRSMTTAELQGTEWWRTHTEAERSWLSTNASDPATAEQMIADNRSQVNDLMAAAGINNASQDLINTIADQWTTGQWSQIYATNQIRLLADPNLEGDLDDVLLTFRDDLDGTRDQEGRVESMVNTWLGPAGAQGWTDDQKKKWASRLREDPDAQFELEEVLRRHRLALFPEYKDENLTYEDIAAPWRGVWQRQWGQIPDETDSLFEKIVRTNDRAEAEALLRKEGWERNNKTVGNRVLSELGGLFGGQVRRSDPAVR